MEREPVRRLHVSASATGFREAFVQWGQSVTSKSGGTLALARWMKGLTAVASVLCVPAPINQKTMLAIGVMTSV